VGSSESFMAAGHALVCVVCVPAAINWLH